MSDRIKILFLASNPSDTPQLRLDEEIRAIDDALMKAKFRDKFDIRQHWAVRITDLQACLLRHEPDILHFSGHGSVSNAIILEDNVGNSSPVSARALSQLFSVLKGSIRCVVLNACYSELQARAISEHIDCVIGMSKAIGDTAAISFAAAFYQALGYGKDVETAFKLGCVQIDLQNLNEQDTPQLLTKQNAPIVLRERMATNVLSMQRIASLSNTNNHSLGELCYIPAGVVRVENTIYQIKAFRIGKYPVTNVQYQAFVDAPDGYGEEQWWNFSPQALEWRTHNPKPKPPYYLGDLRPRETVSWYEAIAFCRWLSHRTGQTVTLPSELQWQRAAQGDDNREYPWGDKFDQAKCNTLESKLGETTPVHQYTGGVSPYGVYDMAGNVWEWCINEYDHLEKNGLGYDVARAVRGGSWFYNRNYARVSSRDFGNPDVRLAYIGFRVASVIND